MFAAETLAGVEQTVGRAFRNELLGVESLNSDSGRRVLHNGQYHHLRRNDDLAIIGTQAFDMVLSRLWYRARDTQGRPLSKGDWTRLQQDSISENSLAGRGFRFGLDAYILKNAGTVNISTQMMATALKAIVGAVFEDSDSDLKAVHAAMDNLGFFGHELLAHTDCAFFADSAESPNDV